MGLQETDREKLVKFRLKKSKDTLAEIPVLFENEFYRTAANRLYYACFYAAIALLIKNGYETSTHHGVKTLLGLHYIKENKLEKPLGKMYDLLFNLRQTGDYEDWVFVNEKDVVPLFEPAKQFIETIEKLINDSK